MTELEPHERRLCPVDDLPEGKSRGFAFGARSDDSVFVIRKGESIYVYENFCPHNGTSMSWIQNSYLTGDGSKVECYLHGARFNIEDGVCVVGPCEGDKLHVVPHRIVDGTLVISTKKL